MIVRNFLRSHLAESVLLALCVAMAVSFACALASLTGAYGARARRELARPYWRTLTVQAGADRSRTDAAAVPAVNSSADPMALESLDGDDILAACPTVAYAWQEIPWVMTVEPAGGPDEPAPTPERVTSLTVGPQFFPAYGLAPAQGSLFTEDDYTQGRQVAVLGHDLAARLFGDGRALGRSVRLDGAEYRIVGVLERDPLDDDPNGINNRLYAPPIATQVVTGPGGTVMMTKRIPTLVFSVDDAADLPGASRELSAYLDRALGEGGYSLVSNRERLVNEQRASRRIFGVISILAALGLLVAAVNITNLAAIRAARRARAVAVFRAVGASIPRVFVTLAGEVLSAAVVGALVGAAAAPPLASLLGGVLLGQILGVDPAALVVAFLLSVVVAAAFGTAPLYAAARRAPVEQLKSE